MISEFRPYDEYKEIGLPWLKRVPVLDKDGMKALIRRKLLPYISDVWHSESAINIGCEDLLAQHFYKPQPTRTLEEIDADIFDAEQETEGVLDEVRQINAYKTRG